MIPHQNNRLRSRPTNTGREPAIRELRTYEFEWAGRQIFAETRRQFRKISSVGAGPHSASNPVAAENYLQHAEHYFLLIAAAQVGCKELEKMMCGTRTVKR